MYSSYWQLHEKPFEPGADVRFYYPSESHQAALLKLRYALENQHGAALLAGAAGTGKTALVATLGGSIGDNVRPIARIVFPQMPAAELLTYAADQFENTQTSNEPFSTQRAVARLEKFLTNNAEQGRQALLVIDEAHTIDDPTVWEALRMLLNFEREGRPCLSLLLSGQTSLIPAMGRMPHWEQRLSTTCMLRALTSEETASYVERRLQVAGAKRTIIESEAYGVLHELTQGIPRLINRLCDLALLIGFAEERKTLGADHFLSVGQELAAVSAE